MSQAREVLRKNSTGEIEATVKNEKKSPPPSDCCKHDDKDSKPGADHFCQDKQITNCVKKSGWMRRKSKILTVGYTERESINLADVARLKQLELQSSK